MPASRVPRFLSVAHALAAAVVAPSLASAQTAADTPVSLAPITVSASALNRPLERMTRKPGGKYGKKLLVSAAELQRQIGI